MQHSCFPGEPRRPGLLRLRLQGGAGSRREGVGNRHRGAQRGPPGGPPASALSNVTRRSQPLGVCLQPRETLGCRQSSPCPVGAEGGGGSQTGGGPVRPRDQKGDRRAEEVAPEAETLQVTGGPPSRGSREKQQVEHKVRVQGAHGVPPPALGEGGNHLPTAPGRFPWQSVAPPSFLSRQRLPASGPQ